MRLQMLFILSLVLSVQGIRVPVEKDDSSQADTLIKKADTTQISPIYYVSDDAHVDSYLIPPDPHKPQEVLTDDALVTPATYLLPPSLGQQTDYYLTPTEPGEQTDWYPIAQNAPTRKLEAIPVYQNIQFEKPAVENTRRAKAHEERYVPIPSLDLEPPLEDAPNDYLAPTSSEQEDNSYESNKRPPHVPGTIEDHSTRDYDSAPKNELLRIYRPKPAPTLPLHLIPPQPYALKHKIPTKLYPKKFKPVPIPIAQYSDESASEIPRAKPAKLFKPLPSTEIDFLTPTDEKINYLYRKAENKRKLTGEELRQQPLSEISEGDEYYKPVSTEQETSESFRHPGRNAYPVPLKQAPPKASKHDPSTAPAPEERTEFRMHGMKGPHSYQFGYDTGKGKNRQFRYEERDNDGQVKGHYGYMDKHGKLRVVNYSAHPETGFHADAAVDKE